MEWKEFESKLKRWHEFTKDSWWLRAQGEPLIFKLLWKLKFQVRPPYFASPFKLAIAFGIFFGFAMLFLARHPNQLITYGLSGIVFGPVIALCIWVEARIRKLPRWEDL